MPRGVTREQDATLAGQRDPRRFTDRDRVTRAAVLFAGTRKPDRQLCAVFSPGVHVGGKARIGDYSFFGPGAVVYPGGTVGYNVSVGANSVINEDVADGAVVAGNPARIVRYDAVSR